MRFATDGIAESESGFVASSHTFKVHPDIDPATFGGGRLSTADVNPTEWTVGPTAGQYSRSLWRRVDRSSANFTRPVTLEVHFTLKDTWALSFTHTRQVWQSWEYWVRQRLQDAPPGLSAGFQTADVRPPSCACAGTGQFPQPLHRLLDLSIADSEATRVCTLLLACTNTTGTVGETLHGQSCVARLPFKQGMRLCSRGASWSSRR